MHNDPLITLDVIKFKEISINTHTDVIKEYKYGALHKLFIKTGSWNYQII